MLETIKQNNATRIVPVYKELGEKQRAYLYRRWGF